MMRKSIVMKITGFAVLGAIILVSCYSPVRIMPYVGVPTYPPTDPASIVVLQSSPVRPHVTLGHVIIHPEEALTIDQTEWMLREAAAKMGAHAVVILANMNMYAGANTEQMSGGQVVQAVAIRYKD